MDHPQGNQGPDLVTVQFAWYTTLVVYHANYYTP